MYSPEVGVAFADARQARSQAACGQQRGGKPAMKQSERQPRRGIRFKLKALNRRSVSRALSHVDVLQVCLSHNLRTGNERHRHRPGNKIDPALSYRNRVLWGPTDPTTGTALAGSTLEMLDLVPKRWDAIMGIELVFQPPDGWNCDDFYAACLQWVAARYEHILSAVVHLDQALPHMHVLVLAIARDKLSGAAMTSYENRVIAQRASFLAHMHRTL